MSKFIYTFVLIYITILFPQADFTIIGLPDTQYYSENAQNDGSGKGSGNIATFIAQTNWIVENKDVLNIVYVAHLGDCVENADFLPNGSSNEQEWINASSAMYLLEDEITTGLPDGIPYGVAVGNHDISPWGGPGSTNLYNQYFGISHFNGYGYYGSHYGSDNDNHYDLFTVGSKKFIVVYIEYGSYSDDPPVLSWASDMLAAYSDRYGIVVSHKILDADGTFSGQGQAMFNAVKNNSNLFLLLCGHVPTPEGAHRTDINGSGNGRNIHTILSDFQSLSNGGDGWLRILRLSPGDNKIYVSTYSPTLNDYKTGPNSNFELDYNFSDPLPVELNFFSSSKNGNKVELRWRTETEVNNYGFEVQRSKDRSSFQRIGFIQGHGNSNSPKEYSITDEYPPSGKIYYRLKQIDNDGQFEYSRIIEVEYLVPANIVLSQNYPNPFNPSTKIEYSIPYEGFVSLKVYDILGREVATLVEEHKEAGKYSVEFNGTDLASGLYIYAMKLGNKVLKGKMSLIK